MENFMKRLLCVVLSMAILIPGLNLEVISASAETATFRSYLEPMPNGSSVSDNDAQAEMTSEVLDEPDVNIKSNIGEFKMTFCIISRTVSLVWNYILTIQMFPTKISKVIDQAHTEEQMFIKILRMELHIFGRSNHHHIAIKINLRVWIK